MSTLTQPLTGGLTTDKDAKSLAALVHKVSGMGSLKAKIESGGETNDVGLHRVCIYGDSDAGKTQSICGLLELGLKVFVINTDAGGSGLRTVFEYVRRVNKPTLLDNLYRITLSSYEAVSSFLADPDKECPGFSDLAIDILFWDGFTNFNINFVDEYVLDMTSANSKASDLREAGLFADQQDWGGIKRGTMRQLEKFLFLRNKKTGLGYSKITSCLQSEAPQEYVKGSKQMGPWVQGAARKLLIASNDLVIRAARTIENGKKSYIYDCGIGDAYLIRSRGYNLLPTEVADMAKFWTKITNKGD